jgi:hypothetical protein
MICDHVGWFLQYKGYGTMGTDIHVGYQPETAVDNATSWMVMSGDGLPCIYSDAYNHDHEYVEVFVRGIGTVVKPLLVAVRDILLGNTSSQLHPSTPALTYPIPCPIVYSIRPHGPPREEYRDNKNRATYAFRIRIEYRLLSSIREDY